MISNIVVNAVSIACLCLMALGLGLIIKNLILKNRADRITYVRAFKKGKGVLIYLVAIPLFWVGHIYNGVGVFQSFFSSLKNIVDLVVLKYDVSAMAKLCAVNELYNATLYVCYVLVCLNALFFAFSLVNQYIWNGTRLLKLFFSRKERLILFGNNEQNYKIYNSEKNRVKTVATRLTDKEALNMYMRDIGYAQITDEHSYVQKLVARAVKTGRRSIVIINTLDDDKNTELCRVFINEISSLNAVDKEKCFKAIKIFVFGDPVYEAIYEEIIGDGFGCISYINKYQTIAVDFIDQYPFSRFMTDEHIDYQTSCVKEGVNVNAVMIGFGKTNRQIFLTSVANNQFIENVGGEIKLKKVKYHIFDKYPSEHDKNLNHTYNRYKNECKDIDKKDYLPLPDYPAEQNVYHLDVNDNEFYNRFRSVIDGPEKDVNFVIVAFGTDLENIDMAQKLVTKCKEWDAERLNIFVKVRGEHKGHRLFDNENCFAIGNEAKVIYNIDEILGDDLFKMAQMRNEVYDLEYEVTENIDEQLTESKLCEIRANAYKNWYVKKSQQERDSSLYCCLSLRSKLNLMGLDYVKEDCDGEALTEDEYLSIYAKDDMPDRTFYDVTVDGKPIVHYTLDFKDSRRKSLAIHEHYRWNSFMISKGTIPATIDQIKNETVNGKRTNGKNYAVRRHGNLTTFDGLVKFRKLVATATGDTEESRDVIKYDYQLLDDAFWLLKENGYKIIKKRKGS